MLIIFTGEKDEKKKINQQTKPVCGKKKKNEKAGEKKNHLNVEELASCLVFCT